MQREEGKEAGRPPVRDDANAEAEGTAGAAQTVFGRRDTGGGLGRLEILEIYHFVKLYGSATQSTVPRQIERPRQPLRDKS